MVTTPPVIMPPSTPEHVEALKEQALTLCREGRAIIPIPRAGILYPGPGDTERVTTGKGPILRNWQSRVLTEKQLAAGITADSSGLGIRSGVGGLLILDFDGRDWTFAFQAFCQWFPALADTRSDLTGSGKVHLHLICPNMPADFTRRVFRAGDAVVEMRGHRCQSLIPPSIHPITGNQYEWINDGKPAEADFSLILSAWEEWAGEKPAPAERVVSPPLSNPASWLTQKTKHFLTHGAEIGLQRSAALAAARNLTSNGYDPEAVAEALWRGFSAGEQLPGQPWTIQDARQIAESIASSPAPPIPSYMVPAVEVKINRRNGNGIEIMTDGTPAAPLTQEEVDAAGADLLEGEGRNGPSDVTLAMQWSRTVEKKYAFFQGGQWWEYDRGRWRYSSMDVVEVSIQVFMEKMRAEGMKVSVTGQRLSNVLKLSRRYLGVHQMDELNAHPTWIALRNGVYDTETGKLLPHSPAHFLTGQTGYDYDPAATCPLWERFLEQVIITPEGETDWDSINWLQEFIGHLFLPENKAQVAMAWVGAGQNGKGVAIRLIQWLLGRGNYTSIDIEQIHQEYHVAELHGKLLGLVNEPSPNALRKNGARFKAITGGDEISARRPTERVFSFTPYVRIIISCNDFPGTKDLSDGYFRRLEFINWLYNVPKAERDTNLEDKIRAEDSGIFNWLMVGLRRYRERGSEFLPLPSSDAIKQEYRVSQDTVSQFIADECEVLPRDSQETWETPAKDLYQRYTTWCGQNGIRSPITGDSFGKRLNALGFPKSLKRMSIGAGGATQPVRVRQRIRLLGT